MKSCYTRDHARIQVLYFTCVTWAPMILRAYVGVRLSSRLLSVYRLVAAAASSRRSALERRYCAAQFMFDQVSQSTGTREYEVFLPFLTRLPLFIYNVSRDLSCVRSEQIIAAKMRIIVIRSTTPVGLRSLICPSTDKNKK